MTMALLACHYLAKNSVTVPCSNIHTTCQPADFFLFPWLKTLLEGRAICKSLFVKENAIKQ